MTLFQKYEAYYSEIIIIVIKQILEIKVRGRFILNI